MALSGSFYTYPVGSFGLYCSWSATQNVAGYYSDVTVNVYLQHYAISVGARTNSTIKCGSDTHTYTAAALSYASGQALTKTLLGSHTFRVYHDAGGGNKSVMLSASWTFNGTYSGTYVGTITASSTVSLDAIPQQSAIASVTVDVNKISVNLTRYVDAFKHSVKFVFGNYSHTISDVGTSTSYTLPLEWFNAIPNSVAGVGAVYVTTYSGTSQVGTTVNQSFVATLPADVVPSIADISWTKSSNEPDIWPMTKNVSTGTLAMTGVSGAYGSTIASYSLTFDGMSSNSTTLAVNNIISYGNLDAVAKVVDSRGRSFTKTVTFFVSEYAKPTLTVSAYRSNADGDEDAVGEHMTVVASVLFTAVGDNEITQLTVKYKKHSAAFYTETTLAVGTPLTVEASSDHTWDWVVTAADKVNTVAINGAVATGQVILDILADGSGIKIGGVAEESGLHSDWDYTGKRVDATEVTASLSVEAPIINATDLSGECVYAGQLLVDNQDVVDHVVEQGTSGIWTYRKWYSGLAECWGSKDATPTTMTAFDTTYYFDAPEVVFPTNLFKSGLHNTQVTAFSKNGGLYWASPYVVSVEKVTTRVISADSTVRTCSLWFFAQGKWK